jgi:hypothetical protein
MEKNDQRRLKKGKIVFYKKKQKQNLSNSKQKFSETDIIKMLQILVNKTFIMFDAHVFHQRVRSVFLWATNCASLLVYLSSLGSFYRKRW